MLVEDSVLRESLHRSIFDLMVEKVIQQATQSVLVIEDSKTQALAMQSILDLEGYDVSVAETGQDGLAAAADARFDFVVLDLGLPDMDGLELCRKLKETTDAIVIIVTGRDESLDRIVGLGAGADDYLTKPVEPVEMLLRMKGLAKLAGKVGDDGEARFGKVRIDTATRSVVHCGNNVALTKIEYELLLSLAKASGQAVEKKDLAKAAWGSSQWLGDGHALTVHMANLKKKLKAAGEQPIEAIRGVGYKLAG